MYIIKTLRGEVKCDFDELEKITSFQGKGLVFLRNGAVNPAHITNIVLDEERAKSIPKIYGETDEEHKKRIEADKSIDIFEQTRKQIVIHEKPR